MRRGGRPPIARVHGLSPRELAVARLVAAAETDKVIAATLGIAHPSVSFHLRAIARAWGLRKNVRVQIALRMNVLIQQRLSSEVK